MFFSLLLPASSLPCQHVVEFDTYNTDDHVIEHYFDKVPLEAGKEYSLEVEGTYSIWAPYYWSNPCGKIEKAPMYPSSGGGFSTGKVSYDMAYCFSLPNYSKCNSHDLPHKTSRIEISLDNGRTWFHPTTTDSYNDAHKYDYGITGMGFPLGIRHISKLNSDDYGILRNCLDLVV
jgi:hypothetical protein